MTQEQRDLGYLEDILLTLSKAKGFVEGMTLEQFLKDDKTSFAVIRAFEIVGEATKGLSHEFRNRHPDLPWRDMAGMRDKLIHDYAGVNLKIVWETLVEDVPLIEIEVGALLRRLK